MASGPAGWLRKGSPLRGKREESREKREEKREKRGNGRKLDSLHFYSVPDGRDGREKGRALGERTEESKVKQLVAGG